MNWAPLSFARFTVERGRGSPTRSDYRRHIRALTEHVSGWPSSTSKRTNFGDTSAPANAGRRSFEHSNGCDLAILSKNDSMLSWTTSHPTYDLRSAGGHVRTMSLWSGHRPTHPGSIPSSASSPSQKTMSSLTRTTKRTTKCNMLGTIF
jgi:hypothetical protein